MSTTKKNEFKPDPNQVDFKVYFLLNTEIGKLNVDYLKINNNAFEMCTCEKIFPTTNNKYECSLFSSSYNKNQLTSKEINFTYTKNFSSNKYMIYSDDNFYFNIYIKQLNDSKSLKVNFPKSQYISEKLQYSYYCQFLKEQNLSASYTKRNLIRDVIRIISSKKIVSFSFYLDVFKDCFNIEFAKHMLSYFKEDKIKISEKIEPKTHQAIMKLIWKRSDKVLDLIAGSNVRNFAEKLFLLLLYYYYHVIPTEFPEKINEKTKKYKEEEIDLFDLFFKYEKMFSVTDVTDDNNVIFLLNHITTYEQLICLLSKIKSFSNWLKAIETNKELIYEIISKNNTVIKIDECKSKPEEDKLNEILENIEKIKEFSKTKNYEMLEISKNFYQILLSNCGNNPENLSNLNKLFMRLKDLPNNFLYEFEIKQHNIYENMILNEKLINTEMLICLKKDPFYQKSYVENKYNEKKNVNFILERIKYKYLNKENHEETSEFVKAFHNFNFKEILLNQEYVKLMKGLMDKMHTFDDFYFAFVLVDFKEKNNEILNKVQEKFIQLLKDCMGKNKNIEEYIRTYVLLILNIGRKKEVKEVLNEVNRIINPEDSKKILMHIFTKVENIDKEISEEIIGFFQKDLNGANITTVQLLLDTIKDSNSLKILFGKFRPLVMKEEDIYKKEESQKIIIYKFIKNSGYHQDEKLKKNEYFQLTEKLCSKIKKDLESLNIDNLNCVSIKELGYNFKKRIEDLIEIQNFDNLFDSIMDEIENLIKSKDSLKQIIVFLANFHPTSKMKDEIIELSKKLNSMKLYEFRDYENQINNIIKKYEEYSSHYNQFTKSNFFKLIFKITLGTNIDEKLKKTENYFNSLINLLDQKNFNKIENNIFQKIIESIKTKEYLKHEIKFLKKYFNQNIDTESTETTLMLLSSKNRMLIIIKGTLTLFNSLKIQQTSFSQQLKDTLDKIKKNPKLQELTNVVNYLEEIDIDIMGETPHMIVLEQLTNKDGLIEFLIDKDTEGLRNLAEFVGESDNSSLKASDIQDFIRCVEFMNELKKFDELKDEDFFKAFIKLVRDDKYKNIVAYILKVNQNYFEIRDLYTKNIDKSEFTKKKVNDLLEYSIFHIKNENNIYICKCLMTDPKNEGKFKEINFDEILEIRDRALLKKKDDEDKSFYENAQTFSFLINNIDTLLDYIIENYEKGYPEKIELKIIIVKRKIEIQSSSKDQFLVGENIPKTIANIRKLLNAQSEALKEYYLSYPLIRFISGKLFSLFNQFLRFNSIDLTYFLKYITNDNYKPIDFTYITNKNVIKASIENTNNYLTELFSKNEMTQEIIFGGSILKDNKFKGLKTHYSTRDTMEINVIKDFMYLTGNIPSPQTLLLCNRETTSEEIIAFLYRALLCDFHALFVIMKIESLEVEIGQELLNTINTLFLQNKKKMKSCLLIMYDDMGNDIIQEIKKINGHNILDVPNLKDDIVLENDNIEVIFSDSCGIGKSTTIKDEILQKRKKYIYFPVGGEFTRDEVIQRLIKEKINDNCVIHIDLYDTKQDDLMKEFLFSLLITKWYYRGENIFYLGNKINVKVEIPFGFVNFLQKFPVLNLFKPRLISIEKLSPLKVEKSLSSNLQIVCNYLKFYKENLIDDNNIYIEGISNGPFKYNLKAEILDQKTCENLINEFFNVEKANYYQKLCFINIIASQLKLFTNNLYLDSVQLKEVGQYKRQKDLYKSRSFMISALVKNTQHFTKGAYTSLIQHQNFSLNKQHGKYNEEKELEEAFKNLEKKEYISYKQISPSLIFCNLDGVSLSIITNCKKNEIEYKKLQDLYNSGETKKKLDLIDYQSINYEKFYEELNKVLNLNMLTGLEKDMKFDEKTQTIQKIVGSYVFTSDNFIKMILILFRIQANVPVIMMGETGCGKTSLIRIMAQLLKNDMKILNIHAGITDNDIYEFMIGKHSNNKVNYLDENIILDKKNWIFLDEINTCNSMGLISEMMCKHTMFGIPINNNVTFVAACNPYRTLKKKIKVIGLVAKKEQKIRNLVYTVNPLPYSLLNYVFDFGNLSPEDEEKYVRSIVKKTIINKLSANEINEDDLLFAQNLSSEAILKSQKFIREKNEASSVSLREVRRFNIFFDFFYDYLNNKITNNSEDESRSSFIEYNKRKILDEVINLAIFICYNIRISDKDNRNEYLAIMEKTFQHPFEEVPEREERYIVSHIRLGPGIAKNKALLDNIFTLFVCINTQVPVFICGKPGCSKSLSVQLLFKSMKGENSESPLFRLFPKIVMNSYQGSKTSTSKGVLKIFEKARDVIKNVRSRNMENKKKGKYIEENVISMIYFDEMGLAELSPNNPLKVIHSQLEYDENEDKVAFIGISNWTLDASKMNRGIYLAIPDPDEENLQKTALTIAESYELDLENNPLNKEFFEKLASTYYEYKLKLNKNNIYQEFHGTRDFYNLIKNASNLIKDNFNPDENAITQIGISCLERNFGGIGNLENNCNSIYVIKEIFKKCYESVQPNNEYNVMECIKRNIEDKDGRYLLVISKSNISPYLLGNILNEMGKDYTFYLGSHFEIDQIGEYYSVKILNKILSIMEQGKVLLLKDLESIYPSLYDLFNQNFTVVSEKNFARIALGYSNNSLSFVHNDFKCIILVDESEIEKEEAPFLNRFEKHILSFESLLKSNIRERVDEIYNMIQSIPNLAYNFSPKYKFELKNQLVNCDKEELLGIAYSIKEKNINEIQYEVLKKIVPTFSQDIIVSLKASNFDAVNPGVLNQIFEIYEQGEHSNLTNFLEKTNLKMNIVYTFSSIFENIKIRNRNGENIIKNTNFNLEIKNDSIFKITIAKLKSENDLDKDLINFDENKQLNVCILQFQPNDTETMNSIKFYIENYIKYNAKNLENKIFIFMVHLFRIERDIKNNNNMMFQRKIFPGKEEDNKNKEEELKKKKIIKNQTLISHLANFNQIFIDNLNGLNVSIKDILEKTNKEVFEMKELINLEEEINNNTFNSFSSIRYQFKNKITDFENKNYQIIMTPKIINSNEFQEKIKSIMNREIVKSDNIALLLFKDSNSFKKDDIDFITGIKNFQIHTIKLTLTKIIIKCERDHVLSFLLNDENINDNFLKECFDKYFEYLDLGEEKPSLEMNSNEVQILMGMNIPGIKPIFEYVIQYVNEIKMQFFLNEDTMRNNESENEEELEKEKKDYDTKQEILINKVVNEFKKNDIFKFLEEKSKNEEFTEENIKKIYYDYYTIFLGNQFNCNYSQLLLVLDKLVEKRFENKKENLIKDLSKTMLWMESNSINIYMILDMFNIIQGYKEDLFNIIENIIENKEIILEVSDRSPECKKEVNLALFLIYESCLKSILNDADFLINLNEVKYFEFLKTIKGLMQNAMQLEINLRFFSKEIFNLQSFLQIIPLFTQEGNKKTDEIKELIDIMKTESEFFAKEDINDDENIKGLLNNLDRQYQFLKQIINDKENFIKIIMFIFDGKIKQISNSEYRKKLLDYILEDTTLTIKSGNLLGIILDKSIGPNSDTNIEVNERIEEYLSFAKEENPLYEKFENQKENKILDEVLLYLFESYVISYFDSHSGNEEESIKNIIEGISLKYLDKSLLFIDNYTKNNLKDYTYPHLAMLISIAYIRVYLNKLIDIEMNELNRQKAGNISHIIKIIEGPSKNSVRTVIKFFVLKLIKNNLEDYDQFKTYHFEKVQMSSFVKDFNFDDEKIIANFDYSLLPIEKIELYSEYFTKFMECYEKEFQINSQDFVKLINENSGFDVFINITINKILSNLSKDNYLKDNQNIFNKFSSWALSIFKNINITGEAKEFLKLLYDSEKLTKTTINYFGKITISDLEMILFIYRLLLDSLNKKGEYFYSNLLTKNMLTIIKNNYIPGGEPNENVWINSANEMEEFLIKTNDAYTGAYICSCGQWYNVDQCGLPMVESKCILCGKRVGGTWHVPVDREGHIRVFKDKAQMDYMVKWVLDNKWLEEHPDKQKHEFRCKTIQDFKKDVLEKSKDEYKGAKNVTMGFFDKIDKNVRELSQISYRLLSLIFYGCLYFGVLLEYINNDDVKELLPHESKSIIEIMGKTYKHLETALKAKGINEIQIFLNLIYPKLSNIITKFPLIKTIEIRRNVEKSINELIDSSVNEYENYKKTYIEYNNKLNQIDFNSLRCIIQESIDPLLYNEDKYPLFHYFIVPKYPNKKQMIEELNLIPQSDQKYPIIKSYLNDNGQVKALNSIIKMNPFVNSMIEQYTYKITRDQGKEIKIKDALTNDILKNQFKEFQKGWKNLCTFLTKMQKNKDLKELYLLKYKCRPPMEIKEIKENDEIANVLNDDGEYLYGMYLAAAYDKFISWQNAFLNNIIGNISQSGVLHYFRDQLQKEIYAQDATKSEVVTLNLNTDFSLYQSFEEIIVAFSNRNCFEKNGTINYTNYKNISYNFDLIEEEIGKIILPGKKLFKVDGQRFVTYGFEGYRGGNSTIIQDFVNKYKQDKLEKEERRVLYEFTHKNLIDFNKFMFSIQLLIFYLKNENYQSETSINDTISAIPDFVKINEDCKRFFEEHPEFKLKVLISIYEYIELLCYSEIVENVNEEYKKKLEKEETIKINNYFDNGEKKLVDKLLLATTVRKLISRFLSGKRGENEIKENEHLLYFIQAKEEFWDKTLFENPKFDEEFEKMIEEFTVNVCQAIDFYEVLGGDKELLGDKKEFEENENNNNEDNDDNENIDEEKEKKPRKRRKGY